MPLGTPRDGAGFVVSQLILARAVCPFVLMLLASKEWLLQSGVPGAWPGSAMAWLTDRLVTGFGCALVYRAVVTLVLQGHGSCCCDETITVDALSRCPLLRCCLDEPMTAVASAVARGCL